MERTPVDSSNIISVGYDPEQQILEVEFKGGAVYQYTFFPEEMWMEFEMAPSKGKYFASQVLPRFKDLGYRVQ